ncbi:hypothetical protein [Enhygromyxa salina]|uniref:hypothetical protein n=1 Tax=Enhygromyxa salina TaxID=215803 RepID=UPI000D044513|nr:hypothetical protein [Enhygromyxa salina]
MIVEPCLPRAAFCNQHGLDPQCRRRWTAEPERRGVVDQDVAKHMFQLEPQQDPSGLCCRS